MLGRSTAVALAWAVLVAMPAGASVGPTDGSGSADTAPAPSTSASYTYEVTSEGRVASDLDTFATTAGRILDDRRGWSLGGSVSFHRVDADGDFTLVLASPPAVDDVHEVCSEEYSCRVDDRIYINDDNWRRATPAWRDADGDLPTYRQYLVNHEVGHYLDFDHDDCPGTDRQAPVMQQQSMSLEGCEPTGWPSSSEREQLGERLGVPVVTASDGAEGAEGADGSDGSDSEVTAGSRAEVASFRPPDRSWPLERSRDDAFEPTRWATTASGRRHATGPVDAERDVVASIFHGARFWWVGESRDDAFDVGDRGEVG